MKRIRFAPAPLAMALPVADAVKHLTHYVWSIQKK
jgi:hypothetical protein